MFSDAQDEPLMYLGGGPRAGVTQVRWYCTLIRLCIFFLTTGEQLQFNPLKPHILYAGYRGNATGSIYSWDVRSNVDSPFEVLQVPPSPLANRNTNQRMRFDVDFAGRMLSVGSQVRWPKFHDFFHVALMDLLTSLSWELFPYSSWMVHKMP